MKIRKILDFIEFSIKPKWVILLVFVASWLLFKKSIEGGITKYLVMPYFTNMSYTSIVNLFFYSFTLFLILIFLNRIIRNYRVSSFKVIVFSIISIVYFYYRNYVHVWDFHQLKTLGVYYLDIILLHSSALILLRLRNCIPLSSDSTSPNATPFILDCPLAKGDIDALNRTEYATEVAGRLNATISEKSITIGVHGEWGLGKSSFFRLIKNELEKDDNNIIIDFNPWRGYKGNALSIDFFASLSQSVGKYNDLLKVDLKRYGDTLLNVENSILKSTIHIARDLAQISSIEVQYGEINKALKKLNKKWYFFIDDLDRLSSDEIIELIKLIRNTADFYNLRFILAYDKNYLASALKKLNPYSYQTYLEKIILFEYPLLPIDSEKIDQEMLGMLTAYCKKEALPEIEKVTTHSRYGRNAQTGTYLLNLRDVKRFANAFIPSYNRDHKEVDIVDYVNFELLRIKYPAIVYQLYFNKNKFLMVSGGLLQLITIAESDKKNPTYSIESFIKDNLEYLQIEGANLSKLMILLKNLFTIEQMWERHVSEKSIMRDKNFSNYFRKETSSNLISHSEFELTIKSSFEEIAEKFQIWVHQKKRTAVVDKVRHYNVFESLNEKSEFEKFIKSIFLLANFEKVEGDNYMGYPDEDLYDKVSKTKAAKAFYNNKEEDLKVFLVRLFDDALYPFRAESEFLNYVSENSYKSDFALSQQEVENQLIKYFSTYCKITNEFNDNFWSLYHNCKKEVINGNTVTKVFLPEANVIHQDFAFKNEAILKGYLEKICHLNMRGGDIYEISQIVKIAFGSFEKLIARLVESEYANLDFVKEFVEFYNVFEAADFKIFVPFDFKILKVRKEDS